MSDEEMAVPTTIYVFGKHTSCEDVTLAVLTHTDKGWRCRSTLRGELNHDYPRKASLDDVMMKWLDKEMTRKYVSYDRDEVLDLLTQQGDPDIPSLQGEVHLETFLHADPSLPECERAERVLQHLEIGW